MANFVQVSDYVAFNPDLVTEIFFGESMVIIHFALVDETGSRASVTFAGPVYEAFMHWWERTEVYHADKELALLRSLENAF